MKFIVSTLIIVLITSITGFTQKNNYQATENTEISKLLNQQEKMIVKKMWLIEEMKAEDKVYVSFYGINFYDYTSSNDVKKGLKVVIENTNSSTETSSIPFTMLETYIDKSEITQIIISLDNTIKLFEEVKSEKMDVISTFETKDNFLFGFRKEDKDEFGVAEIRFDEVLIKADFKNVEKSLATMKTIFDNVSNELFLLEEPKKKGRSTETKEEIIDTDI
jgi:hypothetical protein